MIIAMLYLTMSTLNPLSAQSNPEPLILGSTSNVSSFSYTFEVGQGVYVLIDEFNLLTGDHVEGNFSVSNLGPYQRLFTSGTSYKVVDVFLISPDNPPPAIGPNGTLPNGTISFFGATPSQNSFSFNFTADKEGTYTMWTFGGAMDYLVLNTPTPVMELNLKWTGTPIKVNVLSPSNTIYAAPNVSLSYTTNRHIDWAAYSLDGADNETLWHNGYQTASPILTGLSKGTHSLTLYANDGFGNTDIKTVNFIVTDFNTIAVIAVLVTIVCFVISLLIIRKRRKNQ
jgi:hypothetical protein